MSIILSNPTESVAKDGITMTSDVSFYRDAANIVRTPDSLAVDLDIYQDDVVYPYLTVGGSDSTRTITIKCRKFDGNDSANNRMVVHWWTSTGAYGAPGFLTGDAGFTPSLTAGSSLTTLGLTTLNTSLTDSNETITVQISTANDDNQQTFYFMAEVQGIVYGISTTMFIWLA